MDEVIGQWLFLVEEKKADFLFTVKENQPTVMHTIANLRLEEGPIQFQTVGKSRGRLEIRSIWTSTRFVEYLPLPHIKPFFTIKREVQHLKTGKTATEIAYGITSLDQERGTPEHLLTCNNGVPAQSRHEPAQVGRMPGYRPCQQGTRRQTMAGTAPLGGVTHEPTDFDESLGCRCHDDHLLYCIYQV
ncbi:MAG: hypothetical protein HQL83_09970 [Magnetococcales bacterium]|nr:hypothetical protein [Magnetococcales bacterium]